MLPLFAVLLAVFFGMAALVVDLGVATVVGLQLESGADAIALAQRDGDETAVDAQGDAASPHAEILSLGTRVAIDEDADGDGRRERGFEQRVPLFFGHGSMIRFESDDAWLRLEKARATNATPVLAAGGMRERGIGLRAVREQRFELVLRVGAGTAVVPGRADFALRAACWPAHANARVALETADDAGMLRVGDLQPSEATLPPDCNREAGWVLARAAGVTWVGDRLDAELIRSAAFDGASGAVVYVPLVATTGRVIAFGRATFEAGDDASILLSRQTGSRASGNASAVLVALAADRRAQFVAALAERDAWRSTHANAANAWLVAPVLAESRP